MVNSSPGNVQWEEEEPPLLSTSDTVVFLGKGLSKSSSQSTCLKKPLTLRIMTIKMTIISKISINICSIDSYGQMMPVLPVMNKPVLYKKYRSSEGNCLHKQIFISMNKYQQSDTMWSNSLWLNLDRNIQRNHAFQNLLHLNRGILSLVVPNWWFPVVPI